MEGSQDLVAKLKNKYPMLHYFTDRPFGIEIEFYGLDYYMLPPDGGVIRPHNVHSRAADGRDFEQLQRDFGVSLGTDRTAWHLEQDASIIHRGGVELVSPILRGFHGLIEAYRFFQLLNQLDRGKIDESCGFHVHHGVDQKLYRCEHLKELVRIVYPMEDYIYLLIAGGREQRDTCRPMELDVDALMKWADCEVACKNTGCRLKQLWYSEENRYDPECHKSPRYDQTRYHGLNLHSYWYRSTIEFRYHTAVLHKYDEAMQWIIFTQFLVELSAGRVPLIRHDHQANKWMKALCKIYVAFGHANRVMGWGANQASSGNALDRPRKP
ncbi:MAG: hypothetical protein AUK55_14230 [Syntrophobacteraceae bacterium CG2_30_61_12]|nr:MAG: hypothetical protein AUK55_14230 [Syntrophobacteraceae bacterium CG2_30_61_12]PIU32376.1 MAG: hypothetical protein COT06_03050 [Syntrophobacteraceae bacterium CG07_land_8_20_14_0_80_61_8]